MAQSVGRGLGRAAGLPRPGPLPAGVGWAWGGERARPRRLSGVPVHGDVVVTGSPGTLAVAAGHRLAVPVWSLELSRLRTALETEGLHCPAVGAQLCVCLPDNVFWVLDACAAWAKPAFLHCGCTAGA